MQTNAEQPNVHLKQFMRQGYELTQPVSYTMPKALIQQTKLQSLFSILGQQAQQIRMFDKTAAKHCSILSNNVLLLWQSNKLNVIYYNVKADISVPQSLACMLLKQPIKNIKTPLSQQPSQNPNSVSYFILQYQNSHRFTLLKKSESKKITVVSEINEKNNIVCIKFINSTQILLLLKDNSIVHYVIIENKLKKTNNIQKILLRQDERLISGEFCRVTLENKQRILLFYAIYSTKTKKCEIHLKQLQRDGSKLFDFGTYYSIFPVRMQQQDLKKLLIYSYKAMLLFHFELKVYIIQNRFGKFVNTDIISQFSNVKKLIIIDKNDHIFITSIGDNQMQLWQLIQKEVGCKCNLLDKIQTNNPDLHSRIITTWIFIKHNQPNLVLVLDDGLKGILFYLTRKEDKLTKLINQVKIQQQKQQKNAKESKRGKLQNRRGKLKQIEEVSKKLGFENRQFYLKLWHSVEKNANRIYQYLLPCLDFRIIFKQLTLYLRRKKLAVSQIIKMLKKIQSLILSQLELKIDIQLIKQLLKTNFQRRKLKFYSGEIQFDYQQYQQVYKSSIYDLIHKSIDLNLFPSKFKHDILWKEQNIQKPIPISYILREFRLIILEDYPKFLLTVLEPYKLHLNLIISQYPFLLPRYPLKISIIREQLVLLSHIYEEQKIEEHQYAWLQFIRQKQWEREQSSVHFIYNHLFKFHQTSIIVDQLKQLNEGPWFKKNKYIKHSLIELNQQQYSEKLPEITQASSILFFCEKTNRISLQENIPNQTPQILQIMRIKNELPALYYEKYSFYSKLHHFLINQKLIDSTITIKQLSEMQNYKIIVIFFLGDKLKTHLMFNKICTFYPSKAQFIEVIEDFIISEECSKIQLQILINYMKSMSVEMQHEHLEIIGIIITGFLNKIQINQKDKARQFLKLFKKIELSTEMIRKISIFESIKVDCYHILKAFGMSNFTYQQIMHNYTTVLYKLVDQYFSRLVKSRQCIYIEGRELKLSCQGNLFAIYLYLKDKIYSYLPQIDLHLQFCQNILRWNQTTLIKHCFSGDLIIDQQSVQPQEFYQMVVMFMLQKYNADSTLVYTTQFKQHIEMMLSLLDESSPLAIIQRNKIELVNIFEVKLQKQIAFQFMEVLKEQWIKDQERQGLFKQIVEILENKMDFRTFCRVYQLLQKIKFGQEEVMIKTGQFVMFVDFYCKEMFKLNRYDQICEIICFLNFKEDSYKAKYNIMTQCFFKVLQNKVLSLNPTNLQPSTCKLNIQGLSQTKKLIDCYIQNYNNPSFINNLFQTQFTLDLDQGQSSFIQIPDYLLIDAKLVNVNIQQVVVSRTLIWQTILNKYSAQISSLMDELAKKDINLKHRNSVQLHLHGYLNIIITSYYFICKIFVDLESIMNIQCISYFHLENTSIISELQRISNLQKQINFKELYYHYLRALFKNHYLQSITIRSQAQIQQHNINKSIVNSNKQQKELLNEKQADKKIHDIMDMDKTKLVILASDIDLGSNSQSSKAIKRLINAIKAAPSVFIDDIKNKILGKTINLLQENGLNDFSHQNSTSFIRQSRQLHSKLKTYKYIQFSKIKMQYAKGSIASQKYLIEKVIDELQLYQQQEQLNNQQLLPLSNKHATQLFHNEKEMMKYNQQQQQDYKSISDIQTIDLQIIQSLDYNASISEKIKLLISNREYQSLRSQFQKNIIYRFIHEEFYKNIQESVPQRTRKKVNRASTLKDITLSSQIFNMLEIFDDLKLNQSNCKAKMLRSSLVTLSSYQIQTIQHVLFKIFSLRILTCNSSDPKFIFNIIIENMRLITDHIQIEQYLMIVKVIDLFMFKMKEDKIPQHLQQSQIKVLNSYNSNARQIAQLYKLYIQRIMKLDQQKDKTKLIQMIVKQMEKEELTYVHGQILQLLEADERLYLLYITCVLERFGIQFG